MTWTWQQIRDAWSPADGWADLLRSGMERMGSAVAADPAAYQKRAVETDTALRAIQATLTRNGALLASWHPKNEAEQREWAAASVSNQKLLSRYLTLASGFYSDTLPAPQPGTTGPVVGIAPLVIGAIIVGVAAIVWAYVAWDYTTELREETAYLNRELEARVAASREGRQLPGYTGPNRLPSDKPPGGGGSSFILIGLVAAAGVGGAYLWSRR